MSGREVEITRRLSELGITGQPSNNGYVTVDFEDCPRKGENEKFDALVEEYGLEVTDKGIAIG